MKQLISLLSFLSIPAIGGLLVYLYLNRKKSFIVLLIIIIPILWRSSIIAISSRYYLYFLLLALVFSIYLYNTIGTSNNLKGINKVNQLLFCGIILFQIVKCYSSFRNIYIADIRDNVEHLSLSHNNIYIDSSDFLRIKYSQKKSKGNIYAYIFDESNFYPEKFYLTNFRFDGNLYIIAPHKEKKESKGTIRIIESSGYTKKVSSFITNSKKNRKKNIYRFNFLKDLLKKNFCFSPGNIYIQKEDLILSNSSFEDKNTITITGIKSRINTKISIVLDKKSVDSSLTIQNSGQTSSLIYTGFALYSADKTKLDARNYPYRGNNNLLKVLYSKKGSNSIIVDKCDLWSKNCYLALNPQQDLSDIPNNYFAGQIQDIKQIDINKYEIFLNSPLKRNISPGDHVRIHGQTGSYFYTASKIINPDETTTFSSSISVDCQLLYYNIDSFPKGTYYIQPILLSYSLDDNQTNSIDILEWQVSY